MNPGINILTTEIYIIPFRLALAPRYLLALILIPSNGIRDKIFERMVFLNKMSIINTVKNKIM
jgi:hypothetical protein